MNEFLSYLPPNSEGVIPINRREAYEICVERGHKESGVVLCSNPPWDVCKFCGTHFRFETRLVESNIPVGELYE